MPCRQSRGVHRKPRLPRKCTSHHFPCGQDRGVFSAETQCLSQLDEMFCLEIFAVQKCANVARAEMSLLEGELRSASEHRRYIRIKSNVAKRKGVLVSAHLQSWFDQD